MPWGKHVIIDAAAGRRSVTCSRQAIRSFMKELVDEIGMRPHGELLLADFAGEDEDEAVAGITAVQLIESSSIVAHFCKNTGDLYLDVFSCGDLEPEDVERIVEVYLSPEKMHMTVLVRDARLHR